MLFEDLIPGLLFLLFLFFLFRRWKVLQASNLPAHYMSWAFLIHVVAGLFFIYIYSEFYGRGTLSADAGAFLNQSKTLQEVFHVSKIDYFKFLTGIGENDELINKYLSETHHWDAGTLTLINDNKNLLRFHSIIHFFSFGNPLVHIGISIFLTLLGFKFILLALSDRVKISSKTLFWRILLIPSVLFWTSSLLKEPLLYFGIGLFLYALLSRLKPLNRIILLLVAIFFLISFKPYVFICAIIAILFYGITNYLKSVWKSLALMIGLIVIGFLFFKSAFDFGLHVVSRKQFDFVNVGKGGLHAQGDTCFYYFNKDQIKFLKRENNTVQLQKTLDIYITQFGSMDKEIPFRLEPNGEKWPVAFVSEGCASFIDVKMIRESYTNLLLFTPKALYNAVFRPWPWDKGSWLKILAFLENLILLSMLVWSFFRSRKLNFTEKNLVYSFIIFALFLYLLIGLTTPVLGAIVRYRFPALLALVIVICMLQNPNKNFKWKNIF